MKESWREATLSTVCQDWRPCSEGMVNEGTASILVEVKDLKESNGRHDYTYAVT